MGLLRPFQTLPDGLPHGSLLIKSLQDRSEPHAHQEQKCDDEKQADPKSNDAYERPHAVVDDHGSIVVTRWAKCQDKTPPTRHPIV